MLTKLQRRDAYIQVHDYLSLIKFSSDEASDQQHFEVPVCPRLRDHTVTLMPTNEFFYNHEIARMFPEFLAQKPVRAMLGGAWWSYDYKGISKRIKALKAAYQSTFKQ